jgi:methionine aminotransferase
MTPTPDSKLPDVGETIFAVMSRLAHECGAINLSQGYPGFEPPKALLDRVAHYLRDGRNQYAPMPGIYPLRRALGAKIERLQHRRIDIDSELTVCTGATEGAFSTIQALVRQGDEVIVLDPAYDAYEPAVKLAGGVTRHVPLAIDNDGEFSVDWERLADAVSDRTRLVILNFPHNPSGAVLDEADLDTLASILRDTAAFILSDEVYEHIVFEGREHISIARHDELWARSVVVTSFGKTFHATGWKIGYCIAPPALMNEFRRVHQFTVFTTVTPIQYAIADFLESDPGFYESLPDFYEQKRDTFCALLEGSRFRFRPARSTFFQLLDYGEISDEPDVEIAKRWTRDIGVASIPLSPFCATPFTGQRLRFCFAKDDETLERAAEKLCSL